MKNIILVLKRTLVYYALSLFITFIILFPIGVAIVFDSIFHKTTIIFTIATTSSAIIMIMVFVFMFRYLSPKKTLDTVFTQLGLKRTGGFVNSYFYRGQYQGREVEVFFSKGPMLEIHFLTNAQVNFGILLKTNSALGKYNKTFLLRKKNYEVWEHQDKYTCWAADKEWASGIISDSKNFDIINKLLTPLTESIRSSLEIIPGKLSWNNYGSTNILKYNLNYTEIKNVFDNLIKSLNIIETSTLPNKIIELTKFEKKMYFNRQQTMRKAILIIIAIFILMGLFIAGLVLMLVFLGL